MKKQSLATVLVLLLLTGCITVNAQQQPAAKPRLVTEWAAKLNPANPLPEYPRPQLTRKNNWKNLNGVWQYAIVPATNGNTIPSSFQGDIIVPFAIESYLSGVGKTVGKDSLLWYNRVVDIPPALRKGKTLLHFGAVDWAAKIYVNGIEAGLHQGGYDAFTLDITHALQKGNKQTISVQVWDPSDSGPQPAGKQVASPHGIWYTPVTGIWQTVWLEQVPETYIINTRQTPDIDQQQIHIAVNTHNLQTGDIIKATVWDGKQQVATGIVTDGNSITLGIPAIKYWSPQTPFLYDVDIAITRKGKIIDETGTYFGMRKISMAKDANGIQRMQLNNRFLFQYGPLDQGWWPDGLYTAPTDEALQFDIIQTKEMGFNLIRKHVKVEPARWYYHCDKLGILVWQDMPSGDRGGNDWLQNLRIKMPGNEKVDRHHLLQSLLPGLVFDKTRTPESEAIYRKEWQAIMDGLYNFPSIVSWVPFNEAWGQFKTKEIIDWTMQHDPSRLVNGISGGNFFIGVSPVIDLHYYPGPAMPDPAVYGNKQILILGEFGGLGLPVQGHTWLDEGNWGYQSFTTQAQLLDRYTQLVQSLHELIQSGLSAAVYTQTTDVEVETNGIFTYDRKVLKMPMDKLQAIHAPLYKIE